MCIVSLDKALSLHRLVYPGEIELLHVKLCWQLICNRLGSHVGGVNDSHPLLTKGYKAGPLSLILFFKFCSMISYVIKLWYLVWNCCGTSFSENHSDNWFKQNYWKINQVFIEIVQHKTYKWFHINILGIFCICKISASVFKLQQGAKIRMLRMFCLSIHW